MPKSKNPELDSLKFKAKKPRRRKMGKTRPTCLDLEPSILNRMEEYVLNYKEHGDCVPSKVGMACVVGVSSRTLDRWAQYEPREEDDQETDYIQRRMLARECLDKMEEAQERELLNGGLSDIYNASITKLLLTRHGYRDAKATEHTGPDGGPIEHDAIWTIEVVEPNAET